MIIGVWNDISLMEISEFCLDCLQQEAFGADVLRLWVSSVDYTGDVMIGSTVLRQMSDVYRKLRGTLRFLLGNLHDWKVCRFLKLKSFNFK